MVTLTFVFWLFVFLFAIIGAMRGWAQELLVAFSVILGIFIITTLWLVPVVSNFLVANFRLPGVEELVIVPINEQTFWVHTIIVVVFAFFGYQTPRISKIKEANKTTKTRFQDTLMGILVGGINGYLIVGTLWFFLHQAGYFLDFISPPVPGTPEGQTALEMIESLPPVMLSGNSLYFAIAIAFAFVVIVFI